VTAAGRNSPALDREWEADSDRLKSDAHLDLQIHHADKLALFEHRHDFRRDARGSSQVILRPFQQLARVAALPWRHVETSRSESPLPLVRVPHPQTCGDD
jgi:hypothetical protein